MPSLLGKLNIFMGCKVICSGRNSIAAAAGVQRSVQETSQVHLINIYFFLILIFLFLTTYRINKCKCFYCLLQVWAKRPVLQTGTSFHRCCSFSLYSYHKKCNLEAKFLLGFVPMLTTWNTYLEGRVFSLVIKSMLGYCRANYCVIDDTAHVLKMGSFLFVRFVERVAK